MGELYPRQFLKSLGPLFQGKRKESGFSVRDIARSANIAHTIVFDIENKKIVPNPETLEDLFGTLGIPLYKNAETLWPLRDTLDAFFEAFHQDRIHEMTLYYQSLRKGEEILMHSPLRIEYMFTIMIHSLVIEERNVLSHIHDMESLRDCFTDYLGHTLELLKGMNSFIAEDYDAAFEKLIGNEKRTTFETIRNLTYYYLAFISDRLFKKELSLYYARIATENFSDANNFKRKLDLDLLLAKNMIEVGNLRTAQEYLDSIRYAITNSDADGSDKQWFRNLQAFLSYIRKDYDEAFEFIKEAKADNFSAALLKAFIAYRKENISEAKNHLRSINGIKEQGNRLYAQSATIFLHRLGEEVDPEKLEHAIHYVLEHPLNFETLHARMFFTNLIIEYYENIRDYKRALEIAKTIIPLRR